MQTIHKYEVSITASQIIEMPDCALIMTIQRQNGKLSLWAQVNTENEPKPRKIIVVGTGHRIENQNLLYITTIQDGDLVWHFFEELSPPWAGIN